MFMPTIQSSVLAAHGRRVARIIADAEVGDDITASITWLRVTNSELAELRQRGIIRGGIDLMGNRNDSRIHVAAGAFTAQKDEVSHGK